MALTLIVALWATLWPQLGRELADLKVVVFDTEENMAARDRDEEVILKALKDNRIGFRYEGGLGRGYELSVCAGDLARWKELVDGFHAKKELKYYSVWGRKGEGNELVELPLTPTK